VWLRRSSACSHSGEATVHTGVDLVERPGVSQPQRGLSDSIDAVTECMTHGGYVPGAGALTYGFQAFSVAYGHGVWRVQGRPPAAALAFPVPGQPGGEAAAELELAV
jgi:hypothetical protein